MLRCYLFVFYLFTNISSPNTSYTGLIVQGSNFILDHWPKASDFSEGPVNLRPYKFGGVQGGRRVTLLQLGGVFSYFMIHLTTLKKRKNNTNIF